MQIDQTRDYTGSKLYSILSTMNPPEFVKQAGGETLTGFEGMESRLYADPMRKYYPCHTAPATWLSGAYFLSTKDEAGLDKQAQEIIWKRLESFATHFGIESYMGDLCKTAAAPQAEAPALSECALVVRMNGRAEGHYPIRTAQEVQQAASYLNKYAARFPYEQRQQIAANILAKASSLGLLGSLDGQEPWLARQAGFGFCTPKRAADLLRGRSRALARLGKDADLQEKLAQAADICLENPDCLSEDDNLQKIASWVDAADRQYDLRRREGLPSPEEVLFEMNVDELQKMADEHVPLPNGAVYRINDILQIPVETIVDHFGVRKAASLADQALRDSACVLKFAASLTPVEALEFETLAERHGVSPVHRFQKRAQSLFTERLAELALLDA